MLNPIIKESIEIVCFEKNVNKQLEIFLSEEQIIKIVSVVKGRNIYERIFLQLCKKMGCISNVFKNKMDKE